MPARNHTVSVNYLRVLCNPSTNQAALFADVNFRGACVLLNIGDYAAPTALAPVGNDNVASLMIGANVQVGLFQHDDFRGRSSTLLADDPDLGNDTIGANQGVFGTRAPPRRLRCLRAGRYPHRGARDREAAPQVHSIMPAADADWVSFTLDAQSAVVIETAGSSGDTEVVAIEW